MSDPNPKIPAELKARAQWVVYRLPKKVPQQTNGCNADPTDPDTWCDYVAACDCVAAGKADGIGYVLKKAAGTWEVLRKRMANA